QRAYVATNAGVSILDTRRGRLLRTVAGSVLAADPARGRVFVAAPDGTVEVIAARSGRVVHRGVRLAAPASALVDARTGALIIGTGHSVRVVDGRTGTVVRTVAVGQNAYP